MSRSFAYALRPVVINAAKPKDKPYALTDGGGLYLEILPTGTKVWRYKFHFEGRRDKITIGRYPTVSLKDARQVHAELMDKVLKGENPKAGRQSRAGGQSATPEQLTFEAYARQWVEETLFYRSAAYRAQQLRWLESHVFPAIGGRPLAAVAPREVLDVLEPLRTTAVTAEGVRSLIQRIYNYAIRNLVADSNPALMVRGAISVPKRTHHKHLLETEVGRLWRQIPRQGAHFTTLVAVQMLFYTMVRKGDIAPVFRSP